MATQPSSQQQLMAHISEQLSDIREKLDQMQQVQVRTETRLCRLIVHLGAKDDVKIKEQS
jgi:nitrate reductase NapAB chaperone NapD